MSVCYYFPGVTEVDLQNVENILSAEQRNKNTCQLIFCDIKKKK